MISTHMRSISGPEQLITVMRMGLATIWSIERSGVLKALGRGPETAQARPSVAGARVSVSKEIIKILRECRMYTKQAVIQ